MAIKRMFSNQIIDTDSFYEMPTSAQCLYFHLGMKADDDGFVSNPKTIMRLTGCAENDLQILIDSGFLIQFSESKVFVITDFKINNVLKKDRYKPTLYQTELGKLTVVSNGRYCLLSDIGAQPETEWNQSGTNMEPKRKQSGTGTGPEERRSIDKNRIDKNSIGESREEPGQQFEPPTIDQVREYCQERNNGIDPERFVNYYQARWWLLKSGQTMKDWKACVRSWEQTQKGNDGSYDQRDYTEKERKARERMFSQFDES